MNSSGRKKAKQTSVYSEMGRRGGWRVKQGHEDTLRVTGMFSVDCADGFAQAKIPQIVYFPYGQFIICQL